MIQVAIAGLGGFAGEHHRAIRTLEERGECRLVATCDPNPSAFAFDRQGVKVYESLEQLLATHGGELDLVTLPTPIPLHLEQHRQVIEVGAACYLEKPPTLCPLEFAQMLIHERKAKWKTNVGFNFVGDPMRRDLKRRIMGGEFGRVLRASLLALWPRDAQYYARNNWAGKLTVDGHPVYDSPIGNATAHFVQDMLFWCGSSGVDSIADVHAVKARIARRPSIENFDTVMAEAEVGDGVQLRIAVTHSGTEQRDCETIFCERATITLPNWREAQIRHSDGRGECLASSNADFQEMIQGNLRAYLGYLRGEVEQPVTPLQACASFVSLLTQIREQGEKTTFSQEPPIMGLDEELVRFLEVGYVPS